MNPVRITVRRVSRRWVATAQLRDARFGDVLKYEERALDRKSAVANLVHQVRRDRHDAAGTLEEWIASQANPDWSDHCPDCGALGDHWRSCPNY